MGINTVFSCVHSAELQLYRIALRGTHGSKKKVAIVGLLFVVSCCRRESRGSISPPTDEPLLNTQGLLQHETHIVGSRDS